MSKPERTLKNILAWIKETYKGFNDLKIEDFTCFDCRDAVNGKCPFAWDAYNTNGDCLAEK